MVSLLLASLGLMISRYTIRLPFVGTRSTENGSTHPCTSCMFWDRGVALQCLAALSPPPPSISFSGPSTNLKGAAELTSALPACAGYHLLSSSVLASRACLRTAHTQTFRVSFTLALQNELSSTARAHMMHMLSVGRVELTHERGRPQKNRRV